MEKLVIHFFFLFFSPIDYNLSATLMSQKTLLICFAHLVDCDES